MSTTGSTNAVADARPRGGRPRDETIEGRVLPVVREMLAEVGWNELSVRAVAARSGVGRATISRRWASKAELVLDAALGDLPTVDPVVGTTAAGWVDSVITVSRALFERPDIRSALPGLLTTLEHDPELRHRLWESLVKPATTAVADNSVGTHSADTEIDALAFLVIASGAALFASVMPPDEVTGSVQLRIDELLRRLGGGTR
ncbi:TetR family transcriptional regulator [Aldersonia sp. NBC_00410]|uniref:TetR/AcrR family transcriptional regulator n=1 Tax=Aldersonia sp. NBC_00410 TaxID=2975954 RepID=UPI00225B6804|nr:TetR family transcriptional regulator [Aldersonia sp. NBC_00410]MCX5044762.1 TetR family transcriptional regulator [Aldersonia sp. NBC_00410]